MKPQQSSFEQTMLTLKTVGTAQEMQFRQATDALRACDDYEATLSAAQLALHRLCADPLLFASTRASVPGAGAAKLMAALGYRSADGAHFVFEGAKSPVVLRRLALATKALDAYRADERARRATAKFAALPAEPSPGASGTTTLRVMPANERRRYEADDTFAKALAWIRVVVDDPDLGCDQVTVEFPKKRLTADDGGRTLQALGLWPSATLRVGGEPAPPLPPPPPRGLRLGGKPKPSDLFRRVKSRFDAAPAPAPTPSQA